MCRSQSFLQKLLFNKIQKKMSKVMEHLYLSCESTAKNKEWLEKHKITAVVNCTERSVNYPDCIKDKEELFMDDSVFIPDLKNRIEKANKFIASHVSAKQNVVVHCRAGVNRSPTIIMGYLMFHVDKNKSFSDHYKFLCDRRKLVNIGYKLFSQLKELAGERSKDENICIVNGIRKKQSTLKFVSKKK